MPDKSVWHFYLIELFLSHKESYIFDTIEMICKSKKTQAFSCL